MLLVTGGTGFIGSHLLETLSAAGHPTRCLVRRNVSLPPGIEPVRGDLVSGAGLKDALDGVDTVFHLAGVTKAFSPADYFAGNADATRNLAHAIKDSGRAIKLVHVSSLSAAGPSLNGVPVTEDAEPHPVSVYGRSKLEGERIARALLPDAVIVRPPVVYGPRDTGVFQLLKSIRQGLALEMTGGERHAQAIYVRDLVQGILAAARAPQASGRTFFLAHPNPLSWTELRSIAARIMHKQPRVVKIPASLAYAVGAAAELASRIARKPGIVSRDKIREAVCLNWTCDTRRASQELGFTAATPIECGLAESLAWYKEAGWLSY